MAEEALQGVARHVLVSALPVRPEFAYLSQVSTSPQIRTPRQVRHICVVKRHELGSEHMPLPNVQTVGGRASPAREGGGRALLPTPDTPHPVGVRALPPRGAGDSNSSPAQVEDLFSGSAHLSWCSGF